MRTYQRLAVRLKNADRDQLKGMLSGGVQPVRFALQRCSNSIRAGRLAKSLLLFL
jgi:hypothetical protein